jgi:multidrug efflux pump subunit AcrB
VGIAGDREWELWVEADPRVLAARQVSLSELVRALRDNMQDLPGGSVAGTEGDILLRGIGTAPNIDALARIVVRNNARGGKLLLNEVASVTRRLEEPTTLGRYNGKPSVNLTVTKTAQASTIEVADRVRALAAVFRTEVPPTVQIGLFSDMSALVKTRLETVKASGAVGLTMVLLSLYLFLNLRVAVVTALGIPVSFLVAVLIMFQLGYTINMVSLFAFLIALGLVVDDAIIVTENIYRHLEEGMPPKAAAIRGAKEVFWPIMASTATTVAAFLPMFAIGGTLGAFIAVIPVVVAAALIGSLMEAFVVLPSHGAELLRVQKARERRHGQVWGVMLEHYTRVLRWALLNRYFAASLAVAVLAVSLTIMATRVPFQLFGEPEVGQFFINIEAPNTYGIEDSARLAARLEDTVLDTVAERELASMLTNVGISFIDFNRMTLGSRYIQILIELEKPRREGFIERFVSPIVNLNFTPEGTRSRDTKTIINALRSRLQGIPGVQRLSILRPQGGPAGADIEVGVTGADGDKLLVIANEVRDYIRRLPGAKDVKQDLEVGKLEYRYSLTDGGRELGLTQAQIANVIRNGYLGTEALEAVWGERRYPVRVIFPEDVREDSEGLQRLPISLEDGRTVFLGDVVELQLAQGLGTISRRDGQRLATITAEVDDAVTTPLETTRLIEQAFQDLPQRYPGYELLFLGERKEAAESFSGMKRALLIAVAIIFVILAALFKSLLDPLAVMLAVPFSVVGVIFGHLVFDYHLQFLSIIGFLALTGIVINDSLLVVDLAKRVRAQGVDKVSAFVQAGRGRVRPILLTTVTTFLGISPLIFFSSGQTAFLAPMAVSLGFGLLFATGLILVVLPCFYLILDDLRERVFRPMRSRWCDDDLPDTAASNSELSPPEAALSSDAANTVEDHETPGTKIAV